MGGGGYLSRYCAELQGARGGKKGKARREMKRTLQGLVRSPSSITLGSKFKKALPRALEKS